MIKADGGTGDFTTVTLDTAAYEALYAKRADFVITFAAWEGIEAGQRGIPLRTFAFTDYGFPDFYQVVLACDRRWLDREPDLAKAFVSASARGFEFAADHPDDAAAILVAQNPGVFDGSPDLPAASQRFLADGGYLRDAQGAVGRQTLERWQGYSGFLFDQGLLADAERQAAGRAARLRRAVLERVPAVTDRGDRQRRWVPPVLLVLALVALWEAYVRLAGLDPVTLPAPTRVLTALWDFRDAAASHLVPTLVETIVGVAVSVALAIAAAIALDRWSPVRRAVEPLLVASQTIPIVAIAPLFVIWFGFGLLPKVVIVVLVTFFPVTVVLLDGFGRVDPRDGPDAPWGRHSRLPAPALAATLPYLFTGCGSASSTRSSGDLRRVRRGDQGSGSGCSCRRTASGPTWSSPRCC